MANGAFLTLVVSPCRSLCATPSKEGRLQTKETPKLFKNRASPSIVSHILANSVFKLEVSSINLLRCKRSLIDFSVRLHTREIQVSSERASSNHRRKETSDSGKYLSRGINVRSAANLASIRINNRRSKAFGLFRK